jgi:exopolysaccharide biosynthesis polyprenyl glycosylphosphotransferase
VANLRRQLLVYLLSMSDLGVLGVVLYLSVFGRAAFLPISVLAEKRIQVHTIAAVALLFFLWNSAFSLIGLYRSKRLSPALPEIIDLLKASGWATLLLEVVSIVFHVRPTTPSVLLRFLPLTICCLIASRFAMRQSLKIIRRRGRNLRHLIVVGTNRRAVDFATSVLARPELGYRLVGFVDNAWFGPHSGQFNPVALVTNLAGFRSYLRNHIIDEVVVALPVKSFYDEEDDLIRTCREHGVIVRVLTNLFDTSARAAQADPVDTAPVVTFSSVPLDSLRLVVKRTIDVACSVLLLILSSPLMLAVLLLVKFDSAGPAIFAQERIGLNKRRFRIYKFRTMVSNAERLQAQLESSNEAQGPVFKIKRDPRITRMGTILRKTSIDELPQLFNVLKGDMSMVGPRPLPVRDYNGFNQDWQRRRFSVRPGITCLWQISGRSSITFDQWMRLDMEYIDRWSLWLDLQILAKTIPAVVRGTGAA